MIRLDSMILRMTNHIDGDNFGAWCLDYGFHIDLDNLEDDHIDNDYVEGDHIDNDYLEGDQLLCHGGSKRRKEGQCKGERSTTFLSVNFEEVSLCTGRILWCELCQKYTGAL